MRLAYTDEGPGPVVVLLHGFPLGRGMWVEQVSGVGSIYRIIAPDLRGHGDSPAPEGDYTIDEMADDVIELLDTLGLDAPVVVGGLSMGGYVALSIMARYPERVRAPDADGHAARGRFARGGREARGDGAGRAGGRPSRSGRRGHDPSTLLQDRRWRTARSASTPIREMMEQNTARGVVGALRAMAHRPDRTRPAAGDPRADARARRRGGRGYSPGRRPGDGRRHPRVRGSRSSRGPDTWPPTRTTRSPTA